MRNLLAALVFYAHPPMPAMKPNHEHRIGLRTIQSRGSPDPPPTEFPKAVASIVTGTRLADFRHRY
jgi:hypothetical protein